MEIPHMILDLELRAQGAGLSNAEMCRRADVAPITFRRWRNGKSSPNLSTLNRIKGVIQDAETRMGEAP